jgi:hypothetical protein
MESSNRDRENRFNASLRCREEFTSKVNWIAKEAPSELFPLLGPLSHDSFQKNSESFLSSNPSCGSAGKRKERDELGLLPCRMTLCPSVTALPSLHRNWIPIDLLLFDEEWKRSQPKRQLHFHLIFNVGKLFSLQNKVWKSVCSP